MKSVTGAKGWHLFLIASIVALVGCSSKSSSSNGQHSENGFSAQGPYDLGGGGAIHSPPALVIRTIEMVQSLAGESSWEKNVFKHYFITFGRTAMDDRQIDLMFPQYRNIAGFDGDRMAKSPALEAISKKKITLLEKGDCPKPSDEATADASVTKHSLDGEVCFSVGNLTQVAPSDLTRQVMGLMLHEVVHLGGGNEYEARKYQDNFNIYFGSRFGEMIGESYLDDVGGRLYDNVLEYVGLKAYISDHVEPAHIYARFGKVYGQLTNIQGVHDATALRVRLFLKRPETAELFVKKLTDLLEDLDTEFHLKNTGPYNRKPRSFEELEVIVEREKKKINELNNIWVNLEKEALCDDSGKFLKPPEAWVLSEICKAR